jgi:hypothetical protein
MISPTICLQFCPHFADEAIAGHYFLLDPYRSDGHTVPKTIWMLGRKKTCFIRIAPQERLFSRIHATIFFHPEEAKWSIMDGGSYIGEDGDPEYKKSGYGIWVNGRKIRPGSVFDGGGAWIEPGDKIYLGIPNSKVIVAQDDKDTIDYHEWENGWPNPEIMTYSSRIDSGLEDQIKKEAAENVTMWQAIRDVVMDLLNDLQKPPETFRMFLWRSLLLLVLMICVIFAIGIVAYFVLH